jgi:hypothetical protein
VVRTTGVCTYGSQARVCHVLSRLTPGPRPGSLYSLIPSPTRSLADYGRRFSRSRRPFLLDGRLCHTAINGRWLRVADVPLVDAGYRYYKNIPTVVLLQCQDLINKIPENFLGVLTDISPARGLSSGRCTDAWTVAKYYD